MEFTGERMIPEFNQGQEIYLEHMTRYMFAAKFVEGKNVLDIACGSGYGSEYLLKSGAKKVIGVDISKETINYCKEKYADGGIEFLVGGVEKIPVEDNSIDVMVSFETIEHVDEKTQINFLQEVKRVLKTDGIFIVSTPNSLVYPKGNSFHIKELDPKEFDELLKKNFKNVGMFFQDDVECSYVYSQKNLEKLDDSFGISKKTSTIKAMESIYLIAVCKDADLENISEYVGLSKIKPRDMRIDLMGQIQQKDQEMRSMKNELLVTQSKLQSIEESFRWRISNYTFTKLRNIVPNFVFKMLETKFLHLYKKREERKRKIELFQLIKKIESLDVDSISEIIFEKNEKPLVSIVIPVFNKWNYTYNCLQSLHENLEGNSFEIIVVDNGSTDGTEKLFKKIHNVKYIRNDENLGFVGGCNKGAESAEGEYVVFLNNDTQVFTGWLSALVDTFTIQKNVGLVGSKLIYPDGRLQEAGGIVWNNKNAWNYGRLNDPESYKYNYLKDVDYCSGASIMLRTEIFRKLNGFDKLYSPAFYEDTDLAFRVRQLGLRTIYQPKSELFHFEGITAGKDITQGLKKYQEVNKEKFFSRWKDILDKENLDDLKDDPFLARDRSKGKKVMLFMDNNVPMYDNDAGSFIAFKYLEIFNELGYKIIFWPNNLQRMMPYAETLQQMGIEVVYGLVSFRKFIKKNGGKIDVAIVSRPHVAQANLDLIAKNSPAKIIYIPHDLHYLRESRAAEIAKDPKMRKKAAETKMTEETIMRKVSVSLFFSDKEVDLVRKEFSGISADVIPWIQEIENENPKPSESRKDLIFMGGFIHRPNADAVKWFHDEIFPKVKSRIPDIQVTIYGSNPSEEILQMNSADFKVAGFIEEKNVKNIFDCAKIFVAPLRYGAGFKGKIAKAMSHGLPVVTTDIGAEGIGLKNGFSALIANDADAFANMVEKLYKDSMLWSEISKNSIEHVRNNFSVKNAEEKILKFL